MEKFHVAGWLRRLVLMAALTVSSAFRSCSRGGLAAPAVWVCPRAQAAMCGRFCIGPSMTLDDLIANGPALVPFALLWHASHTAVQLPDRDREKGAYACQTPTRANQLRFLIFLSPAWAVITGLTCNVADAQSSREFIAAWLASRSSLDPYWDGGSQTLKQDVQTKLNPEDSELINKLRSRAKEVDDGAGRLFRVRTQVC
jgi:hypothetical protein